jgi:hypothetical protein
LNRSIPSASSLFGSVDKVGTPTNRRHAKQLVFSSAEDNRNVESNTSSGSFGGREEAVFDGFEELIVRSFLSRVFAVLVWDGGTSVKGGTGNKWWKLLAKCGDKTSFKPQTTQSVGSSDTLARHCGQV